MQFAAGAVTAHLLTSDNRPNIVNNHYVPLTAEQAELYQTTDEYLTNLDRRVKAIFLYIDRHSYDQPKPLMLEGTRRAKKITLSQAYQLVEDQKRIKKTKEKTILMTKGIGGIPVQKKMPRERDLCTRITETVFFSLVCCPIYVPTMIWDACTPGIAGPDLEDNEQRFAVVYDNCWNFSYK